MGCDARGHAPGPPERKQTFYLVQSQQFEFFIIGCILVNAMIMAMIFFG